MNNVLSITLVRHGENVIDEKIPNGELCLSSNGIKEAKWVATVLDDKFDKVFVSTSKRAIMTADIISKDKEIIKDSRLLECGFGNQKQDGFESEEQASIRFTSFLKDISTRYQDKRLLLVTHGRLMKIAQNVIENINKKRDNIETGTIIQYNKCNDENNLLADYFRFKLVFSPIDPKPKKEIVKKNIAFHFVRHGESVSNRDGILAGGMDFLLTEAGINQAKIVAESLFSSHIKFDKIFTSPLSRALDTAKIISKKCNIADNKIITLKSLAGCGGGILEGKPYSLWYSIPEDELVSKYGAESYQAQRNRIYQAILDILKNTKETENSIIVSHSSVFQVMQALNSGIESEKETFELSKPVPGGYVKTMF